MGLTKYLSVTVPAVALLLAAFGIFLYRRRRTTPSYPPTHPHIREPPPPTPPVHSSSNPTPAKILLDAFKVTVVNSVEECERFLQSSVPDPIRVVGLDCEWRGTSFNSSRQLLLSEDKGDGERGGGLERGHGLMRDSLVALLQLAFTNGEVLLIRLCEMRGMGERLRDILSSKSVLKFGVGIGNDIQRLSAGVGMHTVGCVDLQNIAVRCGIRTKTSLEGLAGQLLGVEMDKSFHLRCGDWEAVELSHDQINYAAVDAIVALYILQALVSLKLSRHIHRIASSNSSTLLSSSDSILNISEQDPYSFSNLIGQSLEAWFTKEEHASALLSLCQGVIDVGFKQSRTSSRNSLASDGTVTPKKTNAYSVRRSRLYHNCRLLAPDGQLLSTMHRKKLEWYLERGLGSLVSESPMTVQLHFEPAGRPGEDREYYLREKENICAVCGTDKNCVRKNIVPHEYRRHFPSALKEHLSHDVLLLCVSCHQQASHHSALLKQQIAAEHDLYDDVSSQKYKEDPQLRQVKNHARVLLKDTVHIPDKRIEELKDTVAGFHGVKPSELTMEMIQEAADNDSRSLNNSYVSHSEKVVNDLLAEGGYEKLFEFMKRWRQYFLDTMEPNFLPQCWSVEHNPK